MKQTQPRLQSIGLEVGAQIFLQGQKGGRPEEEEGSQKRGGEVVQEEQARRRSTSPLTGVPIRTTAVIQQH